MNYLVLISNINNFKSNCNLKKRKINHINFDAINENSPNVLRIIIRFLIRIIIRRFRFYMSRLFRINGFIVKTNLIIPKKII